MAWQKNGTVTGVTQSLTGLTALKFNQILNHVIDDESAIDVDFRIDGLSTATYAYRESDDGTADVTHDGSGSGEIVITLDDTSAATQRFSVGEGININTEEKLFIFHTIDANTAGAGTAPKRVETVGKQIGTTNAWTRIDILETQAGAFTSDSNLTALGTD